MTSSIEKAVVSDAVKLLALQKLAYREEAEIYKDFSIAPLTQTLDELEKDFEKQLFLKLVEAGAITGSVRAFQEQGTCYIGRLMVIPSLQNRGSGKALMREIEAAFPKACRYELFTGYLSTRNLALYHKLNYREFKRVQFSNTVTLVYLEKRVTIPSNL